MNKSHQGKSKQPGAKLYQIGQLCETIRQGHLHEIEAISAGKLEASQKIRRVRV